MANFIAYYRVSTADQGRSGLGLEAQKEAVRQFIEAGGHQLLEEFTEVETGKGSNAMEKRPQLQAAAQLAKSERRPSSLPSWTGWPPMSTSSPA